MGRGAEKHQIVVGQPLIKYILAILSEGQKIDDIFVYYSSGVIKRYLSVHIIKKDLGI